MLLMNIHNIFFRGDIKKILLMSSHHIGFHEEIRKYQHFLVEKRIFFFFFIWILQPFQEYFTYFQPIVHQRWAKTGEPGEKQPDHPQAELGFPTCDLSAD